MPPLLSLDDALARLVAGAEAARIVETDNISTFDALGRVLAADSVSSCVLISFRLWSPRTSSSANDERSLGIGIVFTREGPGDGPVSRDRRRS